MHDSHRKLAFARSFIPCLILQGTAFVVYGHWYMHIPFTHIVRPRLKGGDPAAGSPTATLLRLLPRC
jgi:hypothetical protein